MAAQMVDYMENNPNAKGMFIVGSMHISQHNNPDPNNKYHLSIENFFEKSFPEGMITVGRATKQDSYFDAFDVLFPDKTGIVPTDKIKISDVNDTKGSIVNFNSFEYILDYDFKDNNKNPLSPLNTPKLKSSKDISIT
jgi:hypothetical protein